MTNFSDLFVAVQHVSLDYFNSPFWILTLGFSGLLMLTLGAWGIRFYRDFINLQQEHFFVERVASLAGTGWAAIRKDTGIIQSQTGLSNYLLGLQKPRHITDFIHVWVEADRPKWLKYVNDIEANPQEGQSIVLETAQFKRSLLVKCYHTHKNFKEIYLIKIFDITSDLNHASQLQSQNHLLRQKEMLYKQHLDAFPFPVWHRDEHMALCYCNQAYIDACDKPLKTIFEENYCLWVDEDSEQLMPLLFQPLKKEINVHGERKVYLFHEFQESENDTYYGFALDLTAVEDLKADFNRHIAAYREVLDSISAGVAVYGADRRIKYFNPAYIQLFKMNSQWLATEPTLGEVLDDLRSRGLLPEQVDYASFKDKELQGVTTLKCLSQEFQHLPDERSFRKIAAAHPWGGSFYIFEEVTAALTLEKQYNTQLAVQRATLDNLYEGIAVFGSDNRLRLTNPAFEKIWRVKDSYGLQASPHLADLLDIAREQFDEVPDWENHKLQLIEQVTDRQPKKRRLFRKDGTAMDFSYVPLPDGSHLISYIDVTDSCRVERMLRERNQALEAADKIKTAFITQLSDVLLSPLNTVMETAEALKEEFSDTLNPSQRAYCDQLLKAANNLFNIMTDIQDITSLENGTLQFNIGNISVAALVKQLFESQLSYADYRKVHLKIQCDEHVGEMISDEMRLSQVLQSLLFNTIQISPPSGQIILKAEQEQSWIEFSIIYLPHNENAYEKGNFLMAHRDENVEDIYSRDTGISLILVKKIIQKLQGSFEITKLTNEGICVKCRFPQQMTLETRELSPLAA